MPMVTENLPYPLNIAKKTETDTDSGCFFTHVGTILSSPIGLVAHILHKDITVYHGEANKPQIAHNGFECLLHDYPHNLLAANKKKK